MGILGFLPDALSDTQLTSILMASAVVALAATGMAERRTTAPRSKRAETRITVVLGVAGAIAFLAHNGFFVWHWPDRMNAWDVYHYYVGSKYAPELGYTRLYACTTLADLEDRIEARRSAPLIRDLRTMDLVPVASQADAIQRCKEEFSLARWDDFKADVRWFRDRIGLASWVNVNTDHGYNPSPVWSLIGGSVGRLVSTRDGTVRWVVRLDTALVLATFAAIGWAFGPRSAFIAMVLWGANYLSSYLWIGDAFLRQMWFAAALGGLCLYRAGLPFTAGSLIALSTCLRLFPGAFLLGPGLRACLAIYWRQPIDGAERRLLAGAAVTGAALVAMTLWVYPGGGVERYRQFAHNTHVLFAGAPSNLVGLEAALGFRGIASAGADHGRPVRVAVRWSLTIAALWLFARAALRTTAWESAAVGLAVIPFVVSPLCYYYTFLVAGVVLGERRPAVHSLLLITVLAWLALSLVLSAREPAYYAAASIVAVASCALLLLIASEPPRPGADPAPPAATL